MLRVELARLAAAGNYDAIRLAEEMQGRPVEPYDPSENDGLLGCLAQINEQSALISGLYNDFATHPDTVMRAREILAAALVHFQSNHTDPLAALVAKRDAVATNNADSNDLTVRSLSHVKQKIKGKKHVSSPLLSTYTAYFKTPATLAGDTYLYISGASGVVLGGQRAKIGVADVSITDSPSFTQNVVYYMNPAGTQVSIDINQLGYLGIAIIIWC
jgi:hypothetical protein